MSLNTAKDVSNFCRWILERTAEDAAYKFVHADGSVSIYVYTLEKSVVYTTTRTWPPVARAVLSHYTQLKDIYPSPNRRIQDIQFEVAEEDLWPIVSLQSYYHRGHENFLAANNQTIYYSPDSRIIERYPIQTDVMEVEVERIPSELFFDFQGGKCDFRMTNLVLPVGFSAGEEACARHLNKAVGAVEMLLKTSNFKTVLEKFPFIKNLSLAWDSLLDQLNTLEVPFKPVFMTDGKKITLFQAGLESMRSLSDLFQEIAAMLKPIFFIGTQEKDPTQVREAYARDFLAFVSQKRAVKLINAIVSKLDLIHEYAPRISEKSPRMIVQGRLIYLDVEWQKFYRTKLHAILHDPEFVPENVAELNPGWTIEEGLANALNAVDNSIPWEGINEEGELEENLILKIAAADNTVFGDIVLRLNSKIRDNAEALETIGREVESFYWSDEYIRAIRVFEEASHHCMKEVDVSERTRWKYFYEEGMHVKKPHVKKPHEAVYFQPKLQEPDPKQRALNLLKNDEENIDTYDLDMVKEFERQTKNMHFGPFNPLPQAADAISKLRLSMRDFETSDEFKMLTTAGIGVSKVMQQFEWKSKILGFFSIDPENSLHQVIYALYVFTSYLLSVNLNDPEARITVSRFNVFLRERLNDFLTLLLTPGSNHDFRMTPEQTELFRKHLQHIQGVQIVELPKSLTGSAYSESIARKLIDVFGQNTEFWDKYAEFLEHHTLVELKGNPLLQFQMMKLFKTYKDPPEWLRFTGIIESRERFDSSSKVNVITTQFIQNINDLKLSEQQRRYIQDQFRLARGMLMSIYDPVMRNVAMENILTNILVPAYAEIHNLVNGKKVGLGNLPKIFGLMTGIQNEFNYLQAVQTRVPTQQLETQIAVFNRLTSAQQQQTLQQVRY